MSDQQRDGNAPITLISSAGEKKGQIPTRSGPHGKEALRESADLELARPGRSTTGEHAIPMSPFPDEDPPHTSGPNKKKVRPEVEAWAQDLTTGEHKLAALRKASGSDAPAAKPPDIGIQTAPHPEAQSSADVPSWDGVESPLEDKVAPRPPRPKKAPSKLPSIGVMVTGFVVVVAIGVGGFLVFKVASTPKAELVETKPPEEDEFVRRMRAQAEGAPECWKTDVGYDFVYKGPKGADMRADRIADVPHLYRRSASCVRER